jgi:CRP-like cAMP-binding protein
MLLTIEKVAILQGIDIFAGTPGALLAAVTQIMEEIEVEAGAPLITEGEVEDCLYIIVEGQVRIHSHGRTLNTLGPGRSVGELAVLDPEPRSASATAVERTRLFRIDKAPFDEVMALRPEIVQAVMRALVRRIRELSRMVTTTTPTKE